MENVLTLACCQWIGGFLTASALLAAILVVWLGFWVHARPTSSGKAATQDTKREEQFRACLGIAWVCLAIVFVFIACAWAFWDCSTGGEQEEEYISQCAISFGMTAFFMAGYAVLESLFTAALVLLGKADLKEPTAPAKTPGQRCRWVAAMLGVVIGFFLISLGLTHPVSIPWWLAIAGGIIMAGIGTAMCLKWKLCSLKKPPEQGSSDKAKTTDKRCCWVAAIPFLVIGVSLVLLGWKGADPIPWCLVAVGAVVAIGAVLYGIWKVRSLKYPPEQCASDENANCQKAASSV